MRPLLGYPEVWWILGVTIFCTVLIWRRFPDIVLRKYVGLIGFTTACATSLYGANFFIQISGAGGPQPEQVAIFISECLYFVGVGFGCCAFLVFVVIAPSIRNRRSRNK